MKFRLMPLALLMLACGGAQLAPQASVQTPVTVTPLSITPAQPPPVALTDVHGGMLFESNGTVYLIGDTYGCGYVLGSLTSKYCGEVGYSAPSVNGPWQGPVQLFDPAPWQVRCAFPNYGCFRPHVVWDSNTNDWRLWLNIGSSKGFAYAVFNANSPLGPYTYIADAKLSIGNSYGDETIFMDNDGTAYTAYTVIGAYNSHNIAVEQLDSAMLVGTGRAVYLPVPQWVESPTIFKRNGLYYIAYSDPICAFCSSAGTSYAVGASPVGPWIEIRHSITTTSCNGQPASINLIHGQWIYQSDLWTGSMDETSANQWWEGLSFAGKDIVPINCKQGVKSA